MKVLIVGGKKIIEDQLLQGKNVHIKFNTCGRQNCACRIGLRHGPYYYIRKKVGSEYKDIYVKPPDGNILPFEYRIIDSDILAEIESMKEIPEYFANCIVFEVAKRIK